MCGRIDTYSAWGTFRGYCLRVDAAGSWVVLGGVVSLASGSIPSFQPAAWHGLSLAFTGHALLASVDGAPVWTGASALFRGGLAALGSGWHAADFRAFSVSKDGVPGSGSADGSTLSATAPALTGGV